MAQHRRRLGLLTLGSTLALAVGVTWGTAPRVVHAAASFSVGAAVQSTTPYCGPDGTADDQLVPVVQAVNATTSAMTRRTSRSAPSWPAR